MRRTIRKIKDTAGRPIWTPSYDAGMTAKTPDLLMGYAVELNNHMPVPAANAKSISFGRMEEPEFEKLYSAVVNVLLARVLTTYENREQLDAVVDQILSMA